MKILERIKQNKFLPLNDRARDILHPGIKSAEIAAERIAKGLNLG